MTADDVIRIFLDKTIGPWRRLWAGMSRRARRVTHLAWLIVVLVIVPASAAMADDGANTPAALAWINYEDSHGLKIWNYELSLDRGGATSPLKVIWSFFIDIGWQLYRGWIGISCWLVDWTLSFDWLQWVTEPAMNLGASLQQVVDRFGAAPTLLTITALVAALMMWRGRWASGIYELIVSLVIASLAVGIFANPVATVAGDDGLLMGSRDAGLSVASGMANDGDTSGDPDQMREDVVAMIMETFLRRPQQIINFGAVIEDDCDTYQEALEGGPYGGDDTLRNAVKDECGEEYGQVAENPNASMFMSMAALYPTAFFVLLFAMVLCGCVIVAGAYAVYQSIKMIIALVLALLPGGARGSLWMTFAEVIISMVTVVFATVFLSAYLLVIQSLFGDGENAMRTFFVIDVMMLVGVIVFWKGRQRLKASAGRLAAAMAKRPAGGSSGVSSLPRGGSWRPTFSDAYYAGRVTKGALGRLSGGTSPKPSSPTPERKPDALPSRQPETIVSWRGEGGGSAPGDPSRAPVPTGGPVGPDAGSAERVLERVGKLNTTSRRLQTVTQVAAAAYSGGTSAVATAVAKKTAGQAARRTALEVKLRSSQSTSSAPSAAPQLRRTTAVAPPEHRPVSTPPAHNGDDAAARLQARLRARSHGGTGPGRPGNGRR